MKKAKTVKEFLIAARWILENYNWIQGTATLWEGNKFVGCCIAGALEMIETDKQNSVLYKQACEVILSSINSNLPEDIFRGSIVAWNDNPFRTKKQVLKILDKAIANASI